MNRDQFWLTEEQFRRIEPHLPTDTRGKERVDDRRMEERARQAVRRVVRAHLGKKPLTDVHIVRI